MNTSTPEAIPVRKKPWTKARVLDLIVDILCMAVVAIASLSCILPFINILAKSLSDNAYVAAHRVVLWPMSDTGINLEAYNRVFHDSSIITSLWVTIEVTVIFTAIGMFLTICASYALTRPELRGRKVMTFMIMFTMYFTAGTIPDYLLMSEMHMLDTIWCLILPLCFAPYNLLIMKSYIMGIPDSLIEAAKIDGCGEFRILFQIVAPLIKPALATVGLFIALAYWNDWYNAMLYIKDENKYPLQYFLYQQINDIEAYKKLISSGNVSSSVISSVSLPTQTLKMALTVVVTGPIVLAYPFVQKYFVQGITIGAVKE